MKKRGGRKKNGDKYAGSGAAFPRCVSFVARFRASLDLWVVGPRVSGFVGMWVVASGCFVAPVRAPLLSVVAPGSSVAPFFLRFPRCPRSLLLVAASLLPPLVRGSMGLWAAAPVCSVDPVGAPSLPTVAIGLPRCSLSCLPVVPLFRRSRVLFPSVPLLLLVPRCSRLLPPVVASGCCQSVAPVGPGVYGFVGCCSRVFR